MDKVYTFDINLQCIIQRKAGDIRPNHLQNFNFLFLIS